jgi:hypothetical protein
VFAVFIPVGPDPRDVTRLAAIVRELRRHEQAQEALLLVVDDAPEPRMLSPDWPAVEVVRNPVHWNDRRDLMSSYVGGTLEALRVARGLEFAVKLDTDVAIIGSFSEAIRRAFEDPLLGIVGSYDRTSNGGLRDWSHWKRIIDSADRPLTLSRASGKIQVWYRDRAQRETVRHIREAAFRFAPPGAHCLGGAYAVSPSFLGSVSLDWRPWIRTRLSEDVVVGLLSSAAGLSMKSLTARGEPFALAWRGLPGPPSKIVDRGHSIVPSVKCADERAESELRGALQSLVGGSYQY